MLATQPAPRSGDGELAAALTQAPAPPPPPGMRLRLAHAQDEEHFIPLVDGTVPLIIGRSPEDGCPDRRFVDPSRGDAEQLISRRHASFSLVDGSWHVTCTGQAGLMLRRADCSTFIGRNGPPFRLCDGDVLSLADTPSAPYDVFVLTVRGTGQVGTVARPQPPARSSPEPATSHALDRDAEAYRQAVMSHMERAIATLRTADDPDFLYDFMGDIIGDLKGAKDRWLRRAEINGRRVHAAQRRGEYNRQDAQQRDNKHHRSRSSRDTGRQDARSSSKRRRR